MFLPFFPMFLPTEGKKYLSSRKKANPELKLSSLCEPSKSERAILLVNIATEKSTFQQADLPGILMQSEAPGSVDAVLW